MSVVFDGPLDLHLLFLPISGGAMASFGPYIDKLLGLRRFRIVHFATLLQMINREVADRPVRTKLQEADRSIQRNIPKYTTCLMFKYITSFELKESKIRRPNIAN